MALSGNYYQSLGRLPDFFQRIKDAQAPELVTQKLLKDWGFTSSNDRSLIPLLKSLDFLTSEGRTTKRYNDYRDHSKSRKVLGEALQAAYSDIFLIKQLPTKADKDAVNGKFKSFHNVSDLVAGHMAKTFFALLDLADISHHSDSYKPKVTEPLHEKEKSLEISSPSAPAGINGLHYNIQIHLPATKDVEVYNAIFKSLKEHLIE